MCTPSSQRRSSLWSPQLLLLLSLLVSMSLVTRASPCLNNEDPVNNVCPTQDITKPATSTYTYSPKGLINFYIGPSSTDATYLDFLITLPTTINSFFVVFGPSYLNNDAVLFTVTNDNGAVTLTATDSYFTAAFPNEPVTDVSLGGTEDIILLGYTSSTTDGKSSLTVKISRKYDTGDKYDTQFSSTELFLQRALYGVPQQTTATFANYYTGSLYFLLNTLTYPCAENYIFNGSTCVVNNLDAPTLTYVAKQGANNWLTINYEVANNQITMLVTAQTTNYFGIGFGGNLMQAVDMIVFNKNIDNANSPIIVVDDSWAAGPGSPQYDTQLGGTYDITVLGYKINEASIQVKIQRNLVTNDVKDFQFAVNQDIPFSFAFADTPTISYHGYSVGWGTLVLQQTDFAACTNGQVIINSVCTTNDLSSTNLNQAATFSSADNDNFLELQYAITGANSDELTILFTIANVGWFGFGFAPKPAEGTQVTAPTQMTGADILIFDTIQFPNGGSGIYSQDAYAAKNIVPNMDTSIGGTNDVNLLGYSIDTKAGTTTVKVSRKLVTGDVYDYEFTKDSTIGVLYAWGNTYNNLQYHNNNAATGLLNFYVQATSCKIGLVVIDGVCTKNDLSTLASSASDSFLDVQFDLKTEAGRAIFMVTIQNVGWFGFGFGASMSDADMVIVTSNEGIVSAVDYYSSAETWPSTDVSLGGQNNIQLLGYAITDSYTSVKFSRLLDTGDQYDHVLVEDESLTIIYAWGSSTQMKFHQTNYAGGSFPLRQGYKGTLTGIEFTDSSKSLHFWANFFLWGFAIEFGILAARFFKTARFYREVHGIIMTIVIGFSMYVEFLLLLNNDVLFKEGFSELQNDLKAHALIGFIFLLIIALELIGGGVLYYLIALKKTGSGLLGFTKKAHGFIGYSLYVLGKTNVLIGASLTDDNGKLVACIVGTIVFLAIRLIVEYLYAKKPSMFSKLVGLSSPSSQKEDTLNRSSVSLMDSKEEFSEFIQALNSDRTTQEIKGEFRSRKFVILGNAAFDISKLNHPGGNFILEAVYGRDVGRFLNGSYGLEQYGGSGYAHSKYAEEMLREKYIGEIQQPGILSDNQSVRLMRAVRDRNLSGTTAVFLLSDPSKQLVVTNNLKGLEWVGRHFTVTYEIEGVKRKRIYTNCLALAPENVENFKLVKEYFNQAIASKDQKSLQAPLQGETRAIPLVIKRYESATGFSQYIHDGLRSQSDSIHIKIEGPHGRGLELSRRSTGLHVIVCGGTGVLPFYDFLIIFSKYVMFKALEKKRGAEYANQFFPESQFSNHVNAAFKLKIIAAFNSASDDCNALSLLEFIRKVDSENNLNLFEAVVSVQGYTSSLLKVETGHFTQQYLERHLGDLVITKAFVCGPPAINKNVPIALKSQGLTDDQIMIV